TTTAIHTLSLHDALPILITGKNVGSAVEKPFTMGKVNSSPTTPPEREITNASPSTSATSWRPEKPSVLRTAYSRVRSRTDMTIRSEEHTSELQSLAYLVC